MASADKKHTGVDMSSRIPRLFNLPIHIDSNEARVPLPGISYSDLTRSGLPAPWSLLKMLDMSRVIKYASNGFNLLPDCPTSVAVVAAQRLTFARRFYEEAAFKMDLDLLVEPYHVAKRSASILISLTRRNRGSDVAFVRCHRQLVYLDVNTRKGVDIPEPVRVNFGNCLANKGIRINVAPLPLRHFRWTIRAQHSDTDLLYHVNQSEFLRYCLDTAAQAAQEGQLEHFSDDLFQYPVKQADMLHQGEGFAGDLLDVAVWEDDQKTDTLHFQIMNDAQNVAFASVSFYKDTVPASKL